MENLTFYSGITLILLLSFLTSLTAIYTIILSRKLNKLIEKQKKEK